MGDFDDNNLIDIRDLVSMVKVYGNNDISRDINSDGIVDTYDLVQIAKKIVTLGTSKWGDNNSGNYKYGNGNNEGVRLIQEVLYELGYLIDPISTNPVDGWFGKFTEIAVMRFHRQNMIDTNDKFGECGTDMAVIISEVYNKLLNLDGVDKENYVDNRGFKISDINIGDLTIQYESSFNPSAISSGIGDVGGKSYGAFQFSSTYRVVFDFMNWLQNKNIDFYNELYNGYILDDEISGERFDAAWENIAKNHHNDFFMLQYDFTKEEYYDVINKKIYDDKEFDIKNRSYSLKNVIFSRAVHHGVSGAFDILEKIELNTSKRLNDLSDVEIIKEIYKECGKVVDEPRYPGESKEIKEEDITDKRLKQIAIDNGLIGKYLYYFSRSSPDIQVAVWKRLNKHENIVAIEILSYELGEDLSSCSSQNVDYAEEEKLLDKEFWKKAGAKADDFMIKN